MFLARMVDHGVRFRSSAAEPVSLLLNGRFVHRLSGKNLLLGAVLVSVPLGLT